MLVPGVNLWSYKTSVQPVIHVVSCLAGNKKSCPFWDSFLKIISVFCYWFILNDSHGPAVVLLHVMAWVPFSLEINFTLLPLIETVPSALLTQSNCSQAPIDVRLHVIAWVPFSDETYFPWDCKAIFPPPASTTRNCSHPWATVRLQVIGIVPFSLLTYKLFEPLKVTVCPIGGVLPLLTTGWVGRVAVSPIWPFSIRPPSPVKRK